MTTREQLETWRLRNGGSYAWEQIRVEDIIDWYDTLARARAELEETEVKLTRLRSGYDEVFMGRMELASKLVDAQDELDRLRAELEAWKQTEKNNREGYLEDVARLETELDRLRARRPRRPPPRRRMYE